MTNNFVGNWCIKNKKMWRFSLRSCVTSLHRAHDRLWYTRLSVAVRVRSSVYSCVVNVKQCDCIKVYRSDKNYTSLIQPLARVEFFTVVPNFKMDVLAID